MKPRKAAKPISYCKVHASEIIRNITATNKIPAITKNGAAKAQSDEMLYFYYSRR